MVTNDGRGLDRAVRARDAVEEQLGGLGGRGRELALVNKLADHLRMLADGFEGR